MQRITGLPDEQVAAFEVQIEAAVRASLAAVMDTIARRVEASMPIVASSNVEHDERVLVGSLPFGGNGFGIPVGPQRTLVGAGDDLPPPDPAPPGDALPPGQPYVSPDDLASIPPLWQEAVVEQVLPIAAQVWLSSVGKVHADMIDASSIAGLPSVGSLAAEQYLAQAHNTFDQIGDHLWATARQQLSEGFEAGESIPQLAERLRSSAEVTARTGVLVARTQVIEASNAGSFAVAQASGLQMQKEWIATPDLRTRPTHLAADGQRVDLNEPFMVGGYSAMFPAVSTLPPSEKFSCRCTVGYVMPDKAPGQVRAQDALDQQIQDLPGTSGIDDVAAQQSARLQAIIDQQHADVEAAIEEVHRRFGETFGREAGPGFDLPARGEHPPSYIRPSLAGAKTPRELRRVWQDEVQALTGHPFLVDRMPTGVSMVTAREYAEGTLQMFAQFPGAKVDRIHWFEDFKSSSYAQVRRGGHAIEFNMRYASEAGRPKFLAARRRDVAGWDDPSLTTSWGVRNDLGGQGVVYHEFTHILDIENAREAIHGKIVPLLIQHAQREGITDIDDLVKRRISSYATKNYQEMVAEAGTDVMVNGAAASQLSRDIFDLVRAEYRRRGFEVRLTPVEDLGGEVFPKVAGPKPQTVAQLRAELKARGGITPAPGARKADLQRMLDEAPSTPGSIAPTSMTLEQLRAELKAYDILIPPGARKEDLVRLVEQRTAPGFGGTRRINGNAGAAATGLTGEEYNALLHYAGGGFGPTNRELRGISRAGEIPAKAEDAAVVDRLMTDSLTTEDVTVYRGLRTGNGIFGPRAERPVDLAGFEWSDDGFLSTALNENSAAAFARGPIGGEGGVLLRIKVPRGTGALDLRGAGLQEDELLLQRGLRLRVTGEGGVLRLPHGSQARVLDVEVVPPGPTTAVREVVEAPPLSRAPLAYQARQDALRADAARPTLPDKSRRMSGANAITTQVEHQGGPPTITKDFSRLGEGPAASKRRADAEELGALTSEAVGIRAPTVIRTGPRSVEMEHVDGQLGDEITRVGQPIEATGITETDDGRLLGLADILMGNSDRNGGNWLRLSDGHLVAIDHEDAFYTGKLVGADDPFGAALVGRKGLDNAKWPKVIDINPADLAVIRTRLEALRPEFERLGRATWHRQVMARLVEVEKRADPNAAIRLAEARPDLAAIRPNPTGSDYQRRVSVLDLLRRKSKIKSEQLSGGAVGDTSLITYSGGRRAVQKNFEHSAVPGGAAERAAGQTLLVDREILAPKLVEAVGGRAAATTRIADREILTEYIDGPTWKDLAGKGWHQDSAKLARFEELRDSDEGRLLGLADYLSGNTDRPGNWIPLDRQIIAIDHDAAFREQGGLKVWASDFTDYLHRSDGYELRSIIDINPADLAVIRTRLEALRSDFSEMGHGDWLDNALRRLDAVEQRADAAAPIRLAKSVDTRTAQRAAARAQAATIATQRANAALIARVDELVQAKASKAVIRQELDPTLREAEQLYAGADKAVADALRTAVDSGDAAKIRAALTRQSKTSGLTPIGKAGAKAKFDPATMEGVGGTAIPDGADVIVVRRGAKLAGIETPEKATVRLARAPSTAKTVAKGDFTGLARTSEAMGGNPGGIFEAGDGSRWYVKAAAGDAQARSEALALDLYRAAGLDAPELVIGEGVEGLGRRQVATRFLDDAQVDLRTRLANDPTYIAEVQDGFATDAWLANWDVVGANPAPGKGWDNIVSVGGRPVRIEAGGALRFRGLGGSKPFGDDVLEFDTLRDTATGRRSGAVFGDMTPEQLIASAERVRKVTPAKIRALVKKHGLDPELADTLIARRADILRRAEALAGPKPMTVREYNAAIKAAVSGQEALDSAPIGLSGPADQVWRGLDSDELRGALFRYTEQDFQPVNNLLRGDARLRIHERLTDEIRRIDAALDQSRLVDDVVTWRGPGSGRGIFGDSSTWGDDLAGFEWTESSYGSTSTNKAVATRFIQDGGPRFRIIVRRGSKVIQLSNGTYEAELLIARGARYRVVRDRGWTEIKHPTTHQAIRVRDLDVEVIVPDVTPSLPWTTK